MFSLGKAKKITCFTSLTLAACILEANTVVAETATLEEVVVTARKREESLQDLPSTVSVLQGNFLEESGASALMDYAGFIPGLQVVRGGPSSSQIVMRGVTTGFIREDVSELRETVGLYIDEVPVAVQRVNPDFLLYDLQRVEALRGPQPTLYGAGSLSGTLRMITNKPDATVLNGRAEISGSSTENGGGNFTANAVFNIPLVTDIAAARVTLSHKDLAGFIDNVRSGKDDVNNETVTAGRLALRVIPSDRFTIDASIMHQEMDLDDRGNVYGGTGNGGDLTSNTAINETVDDEILVGSLTFEYDLGFATLTSATGYLDKEQVALGDIGSLTSFLTGAIGPNGELQEDGFVGELFNTMEQQEVSTEIRLMSNSDGKFHWLAGFFYHDQENFFSQDLPVPGIDVASGLPAALFGAPQDNIFRSRITNNTKQYAVFAEIQYDFTEKLTLELGARYFKADQDSNVDFAGIFASPNITTVAFDTSENDINPKVGLSYQLDEQHLLYTTAARGFRLGGTTEPIPNTLCAADLAANNISGAPEDFGSDSLWSYEIGSKNTWFDNRLSINGTAYYLDWSDTADVVILDCGFSLISNIGDVAVKGLELEMDAWLSETLRLRVTAEYNDSRVDQSRVLGVQDDDRSPYSPKWSGSLMLDYERPLSTGATGFAHFDVSYVGDRYSEYGESGFESPSYAIGNLRLGVSKDRWKVAVYIDNLWDERAILTRVNAYNEAGLGGGVRVGVNRPRTFGIRVSSSFGG